MVAETQAPPRPRRGQDPTVRSDPYSATYRGSSSTTDQYFVQSASSHYRYLVCVGRDDDYASCTCPAHRHCWHIDMARLRRDCDRMYQNCANTYRHCDLEACQQDEYILQRRLAEADSWLIRAQLGACGDRIAELTTTEEAA